MRSKATLRQKSIPGIMGGMSTVSSNHFKQLMHNAYQNIFAPDPVDIKYAGRDLDMDQVEIWQNTGRWNDWRDEMMIKATELKADGADFIAVISNTAHCFADDIERAADKPLLHIATPTIQAIKNDGLKTVGLLGTKYTMTERYLIDKFEQAGIKVIVPNNFDIKTVHGIIFRELIHDIVKPASRVHYDAVIDNMRAAGAQAIVLGCTEVGMLITPQSGNKYTYQRAGVPVRDPETIPVYDTNLLHARAVAAAAYYGYDMWKKSLRLK
ncbi:MAG: amino acid racemase [Proteobacteria bacterium]|nr:amino acid racemase [Pseudomonadota bacterium]